MWWYLSPSILIIFIYKHKTHSYENKTSLTLPCHSWIKKTTSICNLQIHKTRNKMRYSFYYAYTIQSPRNYSIINKLNIKLNMVLNNIVNIIFYQISHLLETLVWVFFPEPKRTNKTLGIFLFLHCIYNMYNGSHFITFTD